MKLHRSCSSMEKASTKARNLDKTVETGTLAMAENQEENWTYGGIYTVMGSMISWMNFQYFSWNLFCGYLWVIGAGCLHQNPRWLDLWVFFENRVTENPIVYHDFPHMFPILQSMCFLLLSQVQTYPTILLLVIYSFIYIYTHIHKYIIIKIIIYPYIPWYPH